MDLSTRLSENLADVQGRIAAAATRSGRSPQAVRLVAVTKYVDERLTRLIVEAGATDLGESRPQNLWRKAEALADLKTIRWHQIGSLQKNKVKRTAPLVACIHSIDDAALLATVDKAAGESGSSPEVLLEVNISGDATKHGFTPDALPTFVASLTRPAGVRIVGLMGMAALEGGVEAARRDFDSLRTLRDRLRQTAPEWLGLDELSMGMSGDYEAAIECGATIVRVGSALFEGIDLDALSSSPEAE